MFSDNYDDVVEVYCSDSPGFGGAELDLIRVLEMQLTARRHVLHSVHAAPEFLELLEKRQVDASAVFSKGNTVRTIFAGLRTALRCIRKFPNALFIVWCHHLDSNRWLQLGLALSGARFVIVERAIPADSSGFRHSRLTVPIKRFVTRRAQFTVLNGYTQVEHYSLLFGIPVSHLRVAPNSRPIDFIRTRVVSLRQDPLLRCKLGLSSGAQIALYIGRLSEEKGLNTVIEALSTCIEQTSNVQLVLVGDGDKRTELEEMTQKLPAGKIKFVGHCSDVTPYLAAANLFILASPAEGLPGALIEAMAAGLPCVATDIPGIRDLIQHEQNGLLVPTKCPKALASAMERLMSNSELSTHFGICAHEFVRKEYDESVEKECWNKLLGGLKHAISN